MASVGLVGFFAQLIRPDLSLLRKVVSAAPLMANALLTTRVVARASSASGIPHERLLELQFAAAVAFFTREPGQRVELCSSSTLADAADGTTATVAGASTELLELTGGGRWPAPDGCYTEVTVRLVPPCDATGMDDDVVDDEGKRAAGCFEVLGEMHPPEEPLVGTIDDAVVNGAPVIRLPGWTWLFGTHRAAFVVLNGGIGFLIQLALFLADPQWSPDVRGAYYVAVVTVWTLHAFAVFTVYQRGVVAIVLQTYDFWYVAFNLSVFYFVTWVEVIVANGLPLWVFATLPPWCAAASLVLFCCDGMPDHRVRVALMVLAGGILGFTTFGFLFTSPIRNVAVHAGLTYSTTWGAVGATCAATVMAYIARALLKSALGVDFLVIAGLERQSRRNMRERAIKRDGASDERDMSHRSLQ
jgi:hypothetical protein